MKHKLGTVALSTVLSLVSLALGGCQTVLSVDQAGSEPTFRWPAGTTISGLTVLADEDCAQLRGKSRADRVWWQLSGPLTSPVTYGKVPPGVTALAPARPLGRDCSPYVVTITDQALQGESAKFRP